MRITRSLSMNWRISRLGLLLVLMAFISFELNAQMEWDMVKTDDDIKVYTRKPTDSNFKEIKIEAYVKTSLNALMAAFHDVDSHKEWVYKTPESKLIKIGEDQGIIYYVRLDFPFPAQDRDLVIHYEWDQDSETKVITTKSFASSENIPINEEMIRVEQFYSKYILTPMKDGMVFIEYVGKMDPGGSLPSWLVNLGISIGPTRSMKSLFELLQSGRYDNHRIEGVRELTRS